MSAPESIDQPSSGPAADAVAVAALVDRARTENFPVASQFLPPRVRSHLLAIYGFARLVDYVGDEAPGDRLPLLNWLDDDVQRLYGSGSARHPLVQRLAGTVDRFDIPEALLRDLIEANRRDQTVTRYATFDELRAYCALSANPVGRMVLAVFDAVTPVHAELSDRVCTGLQLAEHWQDIAEDADAGRVYLPAEDLERFGVQEDDLAARRMTRAFRDLLAFEVARARAELAAGPALIASLSGQARIAIAGFVAGGRAALRAIELGGYDVLRGAPRPSRSLRARMLVATLREGRRRSQRR